MLCLNKAMSGIASAGCMLRSIEQNIIARKLNFAELGF